MVLNHFWKIMKIVFLTATLTQNGNSVPPHLAFSALGLSKVQNWTLAHFWHWKQSEKPLTLFYMGGGAKRPPWLIMVLICNPWGMPKMGWFFMTLYLSILGRSWEGQFWHSFLKFPKNFASTIFSTYNPKGGPFYASVRTPFARIFLSFFEPKMVIIQLQMH